MIEVSNLVMCRPVLYNKTVIAPAKLTLTNTTLQEKEISDRQ